MDILKRDSLNEGGFAGLKEHRLIKGPEIFGPQGRCRSVRSTSRF